jgi:hypothetical protein
MQAMKPGQFEYRQPFSKQDAVSVMADVIQIRRRGPLQASPGDTGSAAACA